MSGIRLEALFQVYLVSLMSHNHKGREPRMCLLLRPAGWVAESQDLAEV